MVEIEETKLIKVKSLTQKMSNMIMKTKSVNSDLITAEDKLNSKFWTF